MAERAAVRRMLRETEDHANDPAAALRPQRSYASWDDSRARTPALLPGQSAAYSTIRRDRRAE